MCLGLSGPSAYIFRCTGDAESVKPVGQFKILGRVHARLVRQARPSILPRLEYRQPPPILVYVGRVLVSGSRDIRIRISLRRTNEGRLSILIKCEIIATYLPVARAP